MLQVNTSLHKDKTRSHQSSFRQATLKPSRLEVICHSHNSPFSPYMSEIQWNALDHDMLSTISMIHDSQSEIPLSRIKAPYPFWTPRKETSINELNEVINKEYNIMLNTDNKYPKLNYMALQIIEKGMNWIYLYYKQNRKQSN